MGTQNEPKSGPRGTQKVVQNEVWKLELNFDENVKKPLVLIRFGVLRRNLFK